MRRAIKQGLAGIVLTMMIPGVAWAGLGEQQSLSNPGEFSKGEAQVTVTTTITPTMISATVPMNVTVAINPNASEGKIFTSPNIPIESTTNAPLNLTAVSMKGESGSPAVIADDSSIDWGNLSWTETSKQISFGIKPSTSSAVDSDWKGTPPIGGFFGAERDPQQGVNLGAIKQKGIVNLQLQAKHGMAWGGGISHQYTLVFKVELA